MRMFLQATALALAIGTAVGNLGLDVVYGVMPRATSNLQVGLYTAHFRRNYLLIQRIYADKTYPSIEFHGCPRRRGRGTDYTLGGLAATFRGGWGDFHDAVSSGGTELFDPA